MVKKTEINNAQPHKDIHHETETSDDLNNKTVVRSHHEPQPNKKTQEAVTSNNSDSDLINMVIKGRYRIESRIGNGGMCNVYRATDLLLEAAGVANPFVAIKALQNEFINQPDAAKVLIHEAQTTQKLSHPNIIRVYDFGIDKKIYYIVMEYLDGETLDVVIQRSRPHGLPYKRAISLLDQMMSALSYAHKNGVVHADLKPSNIMLTRDGDIKVFDFGIAKKTGLNHDQYAAVPQGDDVEFGGYTPNYASVELLNGNPPSIKDDIFALCCICYELCSSKHPYHRKPADVALKENIQPSRPKHLSPSKWRTVQQGLALDANKRLDNIEVIQAQLHKQHKPVAMMLAAILGLSSVLGYVFYQQKETISDLTTAINQLQTSIQDQKQLNYLKPREIIEQLPELAEQHPIISQGLLRDKQKAILALYEHKIDQIFNSRTNHYPNYYAIEAELAQAHKLYPDSHALNILSTDISTSWQSTLDVITNRINTALEKGSYSDTEEASIYQLLTQLQTLRHDATFKPTSLAEETFAAQFAKAMKAHDVDSLESLIKVGDTFFAYREGTQDQIQQAKLLKQAITHLDMFRAAKNQGLPAPFPYESAELLYAPKFASFNQRLKKVRTESKLDALLKQVDKVALELPADFSSLISIRLASANQYLDFSEKWQQKRKQRAARDAMKKATHQFNLVEKARSNS
ncbi:serine/threonine-protein kinase [Photobacterium kagoshimensis]|uniref:serine/threonine-protein kinase n=1 Tax=Photobacterium kagoshimensis TaxID=2910242 RepID=UPI003D1077C8